VMEAASKFLCPEMARAVAKAVEPAEWNGRRDRK